MSRVAYGSPGVPQCSASASLSGVITDPSGAVVVGAAVRLTNIDTNVTQATQTNVAGLYAFESIPPGLYNLSTKHAGFKETVRVDLVLHVGDAVSQNLALEVGAVTESVPVSGVTPSRQSDWRGKRTQSPTNCSISTGSLK